MGSGQDGAASASKPPGLRHLQLQPQSPGLSAHFLSLEQLQWTQDGFVEICAHVSGRPEGALMLRILFQPLILGLDKGHFPFQDKSEILPGMDVQTHGW